MEQNRKYSFYMDGNNRKKIEEYIKKLHPVNMVINMGYDEIGPDSKTSFEQYIAFKKDTLKRIIIVVRGNKTNITYVLKLLDDKFTKEQVQNREFVKFFVLDENSTAARLLKKRRIHFTTEEPFPDHELATRKAADVVMYPRASSNADLYLHGKTKPIYLHNTRKEKAENLWILHDEETLKIHTNMVNNRKYSRYKTDTGAFKPIKTMLETIEPKRVEIYMGEDEIGPNEQTAWEDYITFNKTNVKQVVVYVHGNRTNIEYILELLLAIFPQKVYANKEPYFERGLTTLSFHITRKNKKAAKLLKDNIIHAVYLKSDNIVAKKEKPGDENIEKIEFTWKTGTDSKLIFKYYHSENVVHVTANIVSGARIKACYHYNPTKTQIDFAAFNFSQWQPVHIGFEFGKDSTGLCNTLHPIWEKFFGGIDMTNLDDIDVYPPENCADAMPFVQYANLYNINMSAIGFYFASMDDTCLRQLITTHWVTEGIHIIANDDPVLRRITNTGVAARVWDSAHKFGTMLFNASKTETTEIHLDHKKNYLYIFSNTRGHWDAYTKCMYDGESMPLHDVPFHVLHPTRVVITLGPNQNYPGWAKWRWFMSFEDDGLEFIDIYVYDKDHNLNNLNLDNFNCQHVVNVYGETSVEFGEVVFDKYTMGGLPLTIQYEQDHLNIVSNVSGPTKLETCTYTHAGYTYGHRMHISLVPFWILKPKHVTITVMANDEMLMRFDRATTYILAFDISNIKKVVVENSEGKSLYDVGKYLVYNKGIDREKIKGLDVAPMPVAAFQISTRDAHQDIPQAQPGDKAGTGALYTLRNIPDKYGVVVGVNGTRRYTNYAKPVMQATFSRELIYTINYYTHASFLAMDHTGNDPMEYMITDNYVRVSRARVPYILQYSSRFVLSSSDIGIKTVGRHTAIAPASEAQPVPAFTPNDSPSEYIEMHSSSGSEPDTDEEMENSQPSDEPITNIQYIRNIHKGYNIRESMTTRARKKLAAPYIVIDESKVHVKHGNQTAEITYCKRVEGTLDFRNSVPFMAAAYDDDEHVELKLVAIAALISPNSDKCALKEFDPDKMNDYIRENKKPDDFSDNVEWLVWNNITVYQINDKQELSDNVVRTFFQDRPDVFVWTQQPRSSNEPQSQSSNDDIEIVESVPGVQDAERVRVLDFETYYVIYNMHRHWIAYKYTRDTRQVYVYNSLRYSEGGNFPFEEINKYLQSKGIQPFTISGGTTSRHQRTNIGDGYNCGVFVSDYVTNKKERNFPEDKKEYFKELNKIRDEIRKKILKPTTHRLCELGVVDIDMAYLVSMLRTQPLSADHTYADVMYNTVTRVLSLAAKTPVADNPDGVIRRIVRAHMQSSTMYTEAAIDEAIGYYLSS